MVAVEVLVDLRPMLEKEIRVLTYFTLIIGPYGGHAFIYLPWYYFNNLGFRVL